MNPVNAHKLLETMNELASAAQKGPNMQTAEAGKGEFQSALMQAIDKTNEMQMNAAALAARYEQGDPQVDLSEVMISLQKSSVSFQALTQVRNRVVSAYQDIMNMPI